VAPERTIDLPTGTVTLVFVDLADATSLVRGLGDRAADLFAEYEDFIRAVFEEFDGRIVEVSGDTAFGAFGRAREAVAAACEAHRRLETHEWPEDVRLRAAIGIHTGEPTLGRGRYHGYAVHHAVLITQAAHPDGIFLSGATRDLVADNLPPRVALHDLGERTLRADDPPERLYELLVDGQEPRRTVDKTDGGELLPGGTVTFLFSDIEGSTKLLRGLGERYGEVRTQHRRLIRDAAMATGGREVDTQGDSFFFVFARAKDAIDAAAAAQRALAAEPWPDGLELRVRMGLHTGEPSVDQEGYVGLDVVRGARICAVARGGQVLVSATTRALLGVHEGIELRDLGEQELKDLPQPEQLYELVLPGLPAPQPAATPAPPEELDLALTGPQLAERVKAATRDLGSQIVQQVENELRDAGLEELKDVPFLHRPARTSELVFAGFVTILIVAVCVGLIVLVLLLIF
jgi:class 3 adenylate cyclase